MPEDYHARISQARELLELAAQSGPEARAAIKQWTQAVADHLPDEEPVGQPEPATAGQARTAWSRPALRRGGYDADAVALSETGDAGIELYPDVRAAGHYDEPGMYPGPGQAAPAGQYTEDQLREAFVADEIARLGIMAQGMRPGRPARPQYSGAQLSAPAVQLSQPGEREPDDDLLVSATMELAARTGGRLTFGQVADAVDELAGGEPSRRAAALVELAGRFPGGSPAADELDLELARRREADRYASQPGDDPRVADIVRRNPHMLAEYPQRGRTHVTVVTDEEPTDHAQPARGGAVHPEVERLLRDHGALLGFDPNTRHPVNSAARRAREEARARPGHTNARYGPWAGG
jgi:hypothetical protein